MRYGLIQLTFLDVGFDSSTIRVAFSMLIWSHVGTSSDPGTRSEQ